MGKHKEWRKIAKKMRRKRIRTCKAEERNRKLREEEEKRAQSPSYIKWLKEQEELETFQEKEEERIRLEQHKLWLENERLAKERWEEQQKKLELIKAEKARQEMIMKEEWEREQLKLKEEHERRRKESEEKKRKHAELMDRIEKYVNGESDTLPSSVITNSETRPGAQECPFFAKVAACRFKDMCSRNHVRPSISSVLLLPGFYSNFRIEHVNQFNEYDTDVGLEYDEKEIYQQFLEFYRDVLAELKTYGCVVQFKVCCNEEPHLRGNVYVQYSSARYAIKAFRALQGRYYGGKRISVEFCNIKYWNKALCGLHLAKKCPKGRRCNFLHVFRNPNNEFYEADHDFGADKSSPRSTRSTKKSEEWRWSTSPESYHHRSDSDDSFDEKERSDRSKRESSRSRYHRKRSTRSRSRSRNRHSKKNKRENKRYSKEIIKHREEGYRSKTPERK